MSKHPISLKTAGNANCLQGRRCGLAGVRLKRTDAYPHLQDDRIPEDTWRPGHLAGRKAHFHSSQDGSLIPGKPGRNRVRRRARMKRRRQRPHKSGLLWLLYVPGATNPSETIHLSVQLRSERTFRELTHSPPAHQCRRSRYVGRSGSLKTDSTFRRSSVRRAEA